MTLKTIFCALGFGALLVIFPVMAQEDGHHERDGGGGAPPHNDKGGGERHRMGSVGADDHTMGDEDIAEGHRHMGGGEEHKHHIRGDRERREHRGRHHCWQHHHFTWNCD